MFLKKIVEEIGIELCGIVSTLKPFPLVNPRLGGIAQGDDMPYSLSLHPNLGTHFDSNHGQITIFYVSPEQQQPQYMPAATHNDNKVKVKVKEEPAQVPVEEAPSWIKPSDPLVGYPKKLDMFLKVVNEIGNEFSGIASMMNPLPLVNPKLGGAFQVAAMSYLLNLYPNLRDMVSHFNLNHGQLPFNPLNLPQQQPRCMPAATHDNNNTKELDIKEEATESLQIKVEEEPVQEEPSDPLVGYPIKNPPGGEEKVVLYTSLAAVKRVVWDCLKVKMILEGYQLDIEEREETEDPKFRDELHNLVGGLRYPRLFVIGREIGGVTEVEMLHKNGQLSGILQYYKQQLENARRVSSLPEEEKDDNDEDDEEEACPSIIKMTYTTIKNMFIGCPIKCPPGGKDKVVLYTWFTAVTNSTTEDCLTMKKILIDYNVDFEERDAKKDPKFRNELQSLVGGRLSYPRLFVKGRDIGDAKKIENMKKTGQLGSILLNYKRAPIIKMTPKTSNIFIDCIMKCTPGGKCCIL